jgi:ubiquinone/menaquinone biosynthesis C-methylase UbiE
MSMTTASSAYFDRVAGEWDTLRTGYFTEAVREAAITQAGLRPEIVVADVGAGTGFMAAGLVNVSVDCTGQSCCAESQNPAIVDPVGRTAHSPIYQHQRRQVR